MHIARLREKLHDDQGSPRIVLTVRGQGYMLAAGEAAMKRLGIGLADLRPLRRARRRGDGPAGRRRRSRSNAPRRRRGGRRLSKRTCNWRSGGWIRRSRR